MNRITTIAIFTIVSLATIGTAAAQNRAAQATVPFDFTVGDHLLPSGTYTIAPALSGILSIKNSDSHVTVLTTTSYDSHESRNGGKLVFIKYGDRYFLHEVLCSSLSMNVRIPTSNLEEKVRLQRANPRGSETTLVAVN